MRQTPCSTSCSFNPSMEWHSTTLGDCQPRGYGRYTPLLRDPTALFEKTVGLMTFPVNPNESSLDLPPVELLDMNRRSFSLDLASEFSLHLCRCTGCCTEQVPGSRVSEVSTSYSAGEPQPRWDQGVRRGVYPMSAGACLRSSRAVLLSSLVTSCARSTRGP